jgi:hypothetical protein
VARNALLRIGDFSRASSLSVKALRAYHEAGLLVPADVDPRSGYRSYSVAQLTDALRSSAGFGSWMCPSTPSRRCSTPATLR